MANILIIDDSQTTATMLERFFVSKGHCVLVASDGRSGLEAVLRERPDLVLLDRLLPEMDGLEVCSRLRSSEGGQAAKVLMLTATADERVCSAARQAGVDVCLTKDCGLGRVLEAAGQLLGQGGAR